MNHSCLDEHEILREAAVQRSGVLTRSVDDEILSIVAFAAARHGSSFAALSIITGRRQILIATAGSKLLETRREDAICNTTIQRVGEPLVVLDTAADKRFAKLPTVTGSPFLRFYAGVPVVDGNGYALGALCIGDPAPRVAPFDATNLMMRAREIEGILRW